MEEVKIGLKLIRKVRTGLFKDSFEMILIEIDTVRVSFKYLSGSSS